jgi:hypothetical protein
MNKPKIKETCKITNAIEGERSIYFWASPHVLNDFKDFGELNPGNGKYHYLLLVSPLYDYGEVLNYIKSIEGKLSKEG